MALAVITNKLIPVKKNQGMNSKLELEYKKKFASCLENKNYDLFLELELTFYNSFVKKIETPDHYNYCYEILNPFEELYGNVILDALNLKKENRKLYKYGQTTELFTQHEYSASKLPSDEY